MGRRRGKHPHLLPGLRIIGGRLFWQPPTKAERVERKKNGLKASVPLGAVVYARGRPEITKEQRERWAELSGYRDEPPAEAGTVREITVAFRARGIEKKPNGKPRSKKTIKEYGDALELMDERFGACRYGKTASDAMDGRAIGTVDIQRYIDEDGRPIANRRVSALSAAFAWAIRVGMTAYNPCRGAARTEEEPRDREAEEWEVEVLRAMAYAVEDPRMALMIDFEEIGGWRVSDIRTLSRPQVKPDWIKLKQGKRGKKQRLLRSQEVNRILADARTLPGAANSLIIFPTPTGEVQTLDAFEKRWAKLKAVTNKALAAAEVPLAIHDLHFQDLRSKAHDDYEDEGGEGHELLGNDEEVADRHYGRRGKKVRPLR